MPKKLEECVKKVKKKIKPRKKGQSKESASYGICHSSLYGELKHKGRKQ